MQSLKLILALVMLSSCSVDHVDTRSQSTDPVAEDADVELNLDRNSARPRNLPRSPRRGSDEELKNTCGYVFKCETRLVDDMTIISWTPNRPGSPETNRCESGFQCPSVTQLSNILLQQYSVEGSERVEFVACVPVVKDRSQRRSPTN